MVKVSFNTALAQKDPKKDGETLLSDVKDAEAAVYMQPRYRPWSCHFCLGFTLVLAGLLIGGGAYLYRSHLLEEEHTYVCGLRYHESDFVVAEEDDGTLEEYLLEERVRVIQDEEVELIDVPVPDFSDLHPATIIHDFRRRLTAYLDLSLNKCYIIPLNTSVVMPPRDLQDLLENIKKGTYLPQTYLMHEEMIVTEKLDSVDQLGFYIFSLCNNKDTYGLQRRDAILGMQKRSVLNCYKIRHFENNFVTETQICEM
ncbi:integral membrane protein 2Bb [Chanos chanos]|uniref:Integral membrane protein 2 n=1 Tax=Chanos chanos TaxID=29144 RepID=A0A6J2WBX5_CHACN|nr:integral membrane protein 2B-like [Chanos chanos]